MKRPKGPELKMPELKAPTFLADLYHDLRDRRLLPLVALVLVAIGATPILLGQKAETTPSLAGEAPIAALEVGGKTSELTVVEANPGLRDYRKRLRGRKPIDPFRQSSPGGSRSGGGSAAAATTSESLTSTSTTSESSSFTGTNVETSPAPATGAAGGAPANEGSGSDGGSSGGGGEKGSGGNGGDQSGSAPSQPTLYSFAVDLTIIHSSGSDAEGNKKTSEPETRKRVLPTTALPGEKKQVVTYMGLSPKTSKPLFLVSTDVTGVFGEGKCVAGTGTCQLIELESGFPEVFEYGEGGDRYKITVTNVEFVVTGHS